jgi:hypothetical protein
MITKEEVIKILSGNHFLKSWEILAEEILALNEKEGFPKYKKYIGINMGSHPKCWNGTVYPIENQVDLDNLDRKNWIVCSKEEYDKQQLKEQLANLKHGEWYKVDTGTNMWLSKFKELQDFIIADDLYFWQLIGCTPRDGYKTTSHGHLGKITNIKSITPATNEEVVRYFPDEFKVKLDYEILAYKIPGNEHWEVTKIGNGTWDNWSQAHVDEQVKKGIWKIKRLKRLYDGEVFSIGDKVKRYGYHDVDVIRGFSSHENGWMFVSISDVVDNLYHARKGVNITAIEHVKSLLTTEDGVEVALGDSVFYVFNDETPEGNGGFNRKWKPLPIKASSDNAGNNYYKLFSTREAALKYIEANQPVYKTHNGEDVLLGDVIYVVTDEFKLIPSVRITKGISIKTGYEIFKSHDEAYQYILDYKPCLSFDDVISICDIPYNLFDKLQEIIKSRI